MAKTSPKNPFLISGYESPEFFCDRQGCTGCVLRIETLLLNFVVPRNRQSSCIKRRLTGPWRKSILRSTFFVPSSATMKKRGCSWTNTLMENLYLQLPVNMALLSSLQQINHLLAIDGTFQCFWLHFA